MCGSLQGPLWSYIFGAWRPRFPPGCVSSTHRGSRFLLSAGSGALISASTLRDPEDLVEAVSTMSRWQGDLSIFFYGSKLLRPMGTIYFDLCSLFDTRPRFSCVSNLTDFEPGGNILLTFCWNTLKPLNQISINPLGIRSGTQANMGLHPMWQRSVCLFASPEVIAHRLKKMDICQCQP